MPVIHRRKLNQKQLDTLELLYRFRFLTTGLLTRLEGRKHITVAYSRLRNLHEQGYIGRQYSGEKRLRGEFAVYYLKQQGVSALKNHLGEDFVPRVGKNLARDNDVTEQFIDHWLTLLSFYASVKEQYPAADFFTRNELMHERYEFMPKPLPDGYLTIGDRRFFVDYIDAAALYFKLTKRVKEYVAYAGEGKLQAAGEQMPDVILLCNTQADQSRLIKKLPFMAEDVIFYVGVGSAVTDITKDDPVFKTSGRQISLSQIVSRAAV